MEVAVLQRMTPEDYSKFWECESSQLQRAKVYEQLSQIVPAEPTLEIGCGSGWGTLSLAESRPVLAVDNNPHLIDLARALLKKHGADVDIIQCDLFLPSAELFAAIKNFQPKVIVGWFIGSHPDDNDKWTPAELSIDQKPKVYRENVEDRLVMEPFCPPSVEWIHTVQRGAVPLGITDDQVKEGMVKEYNEYMFKKSGFTVADVQVLDWDQGASHFPYVQNPNPNLPSGDVKSVIISVLARRL